MIKKLFIAVFVITNFLFSQETNNIVDTTDNNDEVLTQDTSQVVEDSSFFVPNYDGLKNKTTLSAGYVIGANNAFMYGFNFKFGGNYIEDTWDLYLGVFYGMHTGRKNTEHKYSDDGNGGKKVYLDSTYNYSSSYYGIEIGYSISKNLNEVIRPYLGIGMVRVKNDYQSIRTGFVTSNIKKSKNINTTFFNPGIVFFYNLNDLLDLPLSIYLDMNYKIIGGEFGHGVGFVGLGLNYKFDELF
ncbi:MAG TPA: hypothetical protein PK887_00650 [Ignavibacteriales bacterium]|nr:hypothetical protein [Ignavibacteriales bacterium]